MDRDQEVAKTLIVMAEIFSEDLSEAKLELLMIELQPFSLEVIKAGVFKLMRTRKYRGCPTLAEILEAVRGNVEDILITQAEQQWQKVMDLPTGPGTEKEVVGTDPETGGPKFRHRIDDIDPIARQIYQSMGDSKEGWTNHGINYLRNQFIKDYVRIAARADSTQATLSSPNEQSLEIE